jgi:branched-chain amino acid transport system substrate-binding protein
MSQDESKNDKSLMGMAPTRRQVVNAGAALVAAPAILRAIPANAQSKTLKIGFVTPRSGPLAGFAEADDFILSQVRQVIGQGITNNGVRYPVEIIVKDSQSNPNRAAEVTLELINNDKVDVIIATAAPETTNPVADQAEANEIPCITTNCPWQPYFFGRNGNPAKGFDWTYHFFWGLEDVIAAFLSMWDGLPTNKVVGGIFPNDADGNAWGDAKLGLPPALAKAGYKLIDTGRYTPMSNDFTAQISAFKQAGCEIVTGNMIRRISRPSGRNARSRVSSRRSSPSARRCCFPRSSTALAIVAMACRLKSGGGRRIPSSRASTGCRPRR